MKNILLLVICVSTACLPSFAQERKQKIPGSVLLSRLVKLLPEEREAFVEECITAGYYPDFMDEFVKINVQTIDGNKGVVKGYYYVAPDYLSIGMDDDFIRMPVQPSTAQRIANKKGYFLSTRKICNDIYRFAVIRLEPYPLTEDRESLYTFVEHNEIIEERRKGYQGLIAGHKKDVVLTHRLYEYPKNDRVALYGWHKPDGKLIQPIYVGHIDWYVDYSHGIRMVKDTIFVEGKPMHYIDVMKHPIYSKLICDEEACDYYSYPTENNSRK